MGRCPLNAKERTIRAIHHQEADRVPMFMDCTTEDVLAKLIRHMDAGDEEDMLRRLNIDCRWCTCTQDFQPVNRYTSGTYVDLWGVEKTIYGGIPIRHPLAHAETIEDLADYPGWPEPDQIDFDALIRRMDLFPDHCVFGGMWGPFSEQAMLMVGFEKYMLMMAEAPELVEYVLDKTCQFYLQCDRIIFERARDRMQIFFMGDDYGTQTGLMYSPAMWRRFVKPRLQRIYNQAKDYGYIVMHHSCGSVVSLLNDLVEIGLDGIHPIQVTAKGMEPRALKRDFGDRLFFAGSIDAMRTLITAAREEIEAEVRDRIDVLGRGGGFILGPSQGFLPEIPIENIALLYKSGYKYGFYSR
jgi:uroporphyrinogen decarboxylase